MVGGPDGKPSAPVMVHALALLRRHEVLLRWSLVGLGAAVGLVMVARSQVGGDQLNLLARGWLLAERGEWVQFGMPTSAGGLAPGGLTSLVVGVPLMLWQDYRAPTLLLWLIHLVGLVVLDRSVGHALGRSGRLLLVIMYWLSPWQLYFSGHLWNANYMYLFGAVHLATSYASRQKPSFVASLFHMAALGLAFQLHASAPLLALVSVLLVAGGRVRVSWPGATLGAALVALSLLPWAVATLEAPRTVPGGEGFIGRGLVLVFPLLRGVLFWLRYGSLAVSGKMLRLDFTPTLGAGTDSVLTPVLVGVLFLVGVATLAVPLAAHLRLWRRRRALVQRLPSAVKLPSRRWLESYAVASFLGAVAAFAVSPTTVMMWQAFIAFPGALLPGLLMVGALLESGRATRTAQVLVVWAAVSVTLGAVMAVASPHYRRGGRHLVGIGVAANHPMLHDLGIADRCSTPVVGAGGFTPDVFRPPDAAEAVPSAR